MDEIKVSIMIPIYNVEKFLEQCLNSIIEQTLKEIEIICVNDGSKDDSLKILIELSKKDKRIIIINKENGGLTTARNVALKIAKGKYCLNIDSDDWVEKDFVENLYLKAEKNNLDMVISDIFFEFSNKDDNYILKDLELSDEEYITGKEYIEKFLTENNKGFTCNKLIKREIYVKNNIFYNENIFKQEDVEVLLRISYFMKKIGKQNRAFYHYRQGENNGSRKISIKNLKDRKVCYDSLIKFYKEKKEKYILQLLIREKETVLITDISINNYFELEPLDLTIKEILHEIIKNKKFWLSYKKNESLKQKIVVNIVKILGENLSYILIKLISYYRGKNEKNF